MKVLKEMLGSKKAITAVVTTIINIVITFLPADTLDAAAKTGLITAISSIAGVYILGQGVADMGKEAKKLDQASATNDAPAAPAVVADGGDGASS